jgi:hypothetical protein
MITKIGLIKFQKYFHEYLIHTRRVHYEREIPRHNI